MKTHSRIPRTHTKVNITIKWDQRGHRTHSRLSFQHLLATSQNVILNVFLNKITRFLANIQVKKHHVRKTQSRNNPHPVNKSHSTEAQSRVELWNSIYNCPNGKLSEKGRSKKALFCRSHQCLPTSSTTHPEKEGPGHKSAQAWRTSRWGLFFLFWGLVFKVYIICWNVPEYME